MYKKSFTLQNGQIQRNKIINPLDSNWIYLGRLHPLIDLVE